jgi:glycosyltransferase involved in cell wall biosynthesis
LKLLHVTHQYAPAIGGSEQFMTDLSEALALRGHSVDVFTTRAREFRTWQDELVPREVLNGVRVFRYNSFRRRPTTNRLQSIGYRGYRQTHLRIFEALIFAGNGPISPGLAWSIWRQGPQYDLINIQTMPYSHFIYGYHLARRSGRPIVLTPHLHIVDSETFDIRMFNNALRQAHLVVAVSGAEGDYFRQKGIASERILVAGNGIRPERFPMRDKALCRQRLGLPEEAVVLLFLGRKVPYKGLSLVIEAFAALHARYKELCLVAAGPATVESEVLRMRWKDLPRFRNLDEVNEEQKLDLLNACDVLLLPSTSEAFGIVFLEAWAVAKPVIGARAGAVPSVISEGQDGLLAEPNDVDSLKAQIERLLVDAGFRQRLGRAGQKKVFSRYTVSCITDIIERGYLNLIQKRRLR